VWLEARAARAARFVRWLERLFERASHAVVLLLPGPTVSGLAGISGMRARVFVPLSVLGLGIRMLLVLGFAAWLRAPIETLLAVIDEYWIPGTVVLVAGTALHQWRRRRSALRGRS
jgi:membrane protein DedA with SNARE-associated domain